MIQPPIIRAALLALTIARVAQSSAEVDHLAPLDSTWHPQYRQLLYSKIGTARFDLGRVLIEPSFEGESALSVYRTGSDDRSPCRVSLVQADENVWQYTDGGRNPKGAMSVGTKRRDAPFSPETGNLLKSTWMKMLRSARAHPHERERGMPIDTTSFEFSLERPGRTPLVAEVNPFIPEQGPKVKRLLDLAHLLVEYVNASSAARHDVDVRIQAAAKKLLAAR
jgi:hypothetical protein